MIYLFDLDGTLTNSEEGILKAFHYTFKKMGMPDMKDEDLIEFIGPPLDETFRRRFNLYNEENEKAMEYFREYYRAEGKYQNIPYEGIKELLQEVSKKHTLAVATSKVLDQAEDIIEHFGLNYFTFIGGATVDTTRTKKYDIIEYTLEKLNVNDRNEVYMIGDRFTDIKGAHRAGLKAIGVLYGFGSKEELEECNADYIVKSVEELKELLMTI